MKTLIVGILDNESTKNIRNLASADTKLIPPDLKGPIKLFGFKNKGERIEIWAKRKTK